MTYLFERKISRVYLHQQINKEPEFPDGGGGGTSGSSMLPPLICDNSEKSIFSITKSFCCGSDCTTRTSSTFSDFYFIAIKYF